MKRLVIACCAPLAFTGAGASGDARTSGEYYYSDDHYNSFRRMRE